MAEEILKSRIIGRAQVLFGGGVNVSLGTVGQRKDSRTEEIAIPEDVLMCAYNPVRHMLDNKCDYLAKICGYPNKKKKEG